MTDLKTPDEQFYSTRKVASLFNVTVETVVAWIKNGTLEAVKINGYWRIPRRAVLALGNSKYGPTRSEVL